MRAFFPFNKTLTLACTVAAVVMFTGCSDDETTQPSQAKTYEGPTKTIGTATAKSWYKIDDNGNPSSVGVTFSESLLAAMPDTAISLELALPAEASTTPYDHISLDWNPQGHPPMDIYTLPHFDLHFYTITKAERATITPEGGDPTPVAAQYIPVDYAAMGIPGMPPEVVPGMGAHWVDTTAHELHGHAFNHTFIYGFYKGNLVFQEPMFTKAFLETKPNVTTEIKQPAAFQRTGRYFPAKYSIKYDATAKTYTFTLEGLSKR